jgi:hypothetical protein
VEAEAKTDLANLYSDQVIFKALNPEDEATKPIAEKLKVSGQTLLIIIGLFMPGVIKIKFSGMSGLTLKMKNKTQWFFFDTILP